MKFFDFSQLLSTVRSTVGALPSKAKTLPSKAKAGAEGLYPIAKEGLKEAGFNKLFDFSDFTKMGLSKTLRAGTIGYLGLGAAGLGLGGAMAYQLGVGNGSVAKLALGALGTWGGSTALGMAFFTPAQQVLFGLATLLAGFFIGKLNAPERGVARLVDELELPPLAGKRLIPLAAGALLMMGGANIMGTAGPGGHFSSAKLSEVNRALSESTGKDPSAWGHDPRGSVVVQKDDRFTRVAIFSELMTHQGAESRAAMGAMIHLPDAPGTPEPDDTSDPRLGVQIITYERGKEPPEINSLPPHESFVPLLTGDGFNQNGANAINQQRQIAAAAASLAEQGDAAGRDLLNLAGRRSHSSR